MKKEYRAGKAGINKIVQSYLNLTIEEAYIPGVNLISGTFENCKKLKKVSIENTIPEIPSRLFYGCTSLTDIFFLGTTEEWNSLSFGLYWKSGVPATKVICMDGEVSL